MNLNFVALIERIENIDPIEYGKSRNYLSGAVTGLAPYISRGVISTKLIFDSVLKRGYSVDEIESTINDFIKVHRYDIIIRYKLVEKWIQI